MIVKGPERETNGVWFEWETLDGVNSMMHRATATLLDPNHALVGIVTLTGRKDHRGRTSWRWKIELGGKLLDDGEYESKLISKPRLERAMQEAEVGSSDALKLEANKG